MGVYIKGMEMPTEDEEIIVRIDSSGTVMTEYALPISWAKAVPVPPHRRLIDADALKDVQQADADFFKGSSDYGEKCRYDEAINAVANIVNAPTIIPAEPCDNLSKPCNEDVDIPICAKASLASRGIYKKAEEGE